MTIPKQFVDELRNRLPVSDVIGKRVKLIRAGREFKACCPFHNEKTPSFTINDDKGFYHCFGCGAHGDVVGFMMQHDGLSFIESVEQLASLAGMTVPQASPEEQARYRRQKDLYEINEAAQSWFTEQLFSSSGRRALDYLLDRGMKEDTLHQFKIGFAPQNRDVFVKAMAQKDIEEKDLIDLGLIRKGKNGAYAFFRGRVIFPVTDYRGRVVAFGGRILPEFDVQEGDFKPPKYLNSPDHDLFHKGQLLYGLSQARQAGADGYSIILTEGYMDVIALSQAGVRGSVAPLGTALTENQIELLWRIAPRDNKEPYLCFDGDDAGYRAAYRALERMVPMLKPGISARFVFMPQGEDPDTLVRQSGRKGLEKVFRGALSLIDTLWRMKTEGKVLQTPEARAGLKKELESVVFRIEDKDVQHFYLRAIKDKLFHSFRRKRSGTIVTKVNKPVTGYNRKQQFAAEVLLACVINHPALFDDAEETIGLLSCDNDDVRDLQRALLDLWAELDNFGETDISGALKEKGQTEGLSRVLSNKTYLHAPFIRPETESDDVLVGWQQMIDVIYSDNHKNKVVT
jgi:DNA primase